MKDNVVTTDRLIAFFDDLRRRDHHIFALLKDAALTDLYLHGWPGANVVPTTDLTDDITLAEFLVRAHTFAPNDIFTVYLDIRSKYEREYVDPDNINLIVLDETVDFDTDEFERLFPAYLSYLCEKCARGGELLEITQEMVVRCDLTPEDIAVLSPMVEQYNRRAVDLLQREYDSLKNLPFIDK